VQGQGLKKEQKHTTKPNFDEFHNHSPLIDVGRGKPTTETSSHFNLLLKKMPTTLIY